MTYKITESKFSTITKDPTKAERRLVSHSLTGLCENDANMVRQIGNDMFFESKQDRFWHMEPETQVEQVLYAGVRERLHSTNIDIC